MVADDLRSLAKEGLSLLEMARRLNDAHVKTARGCQWGAEGVSRVLRRLFHGTGYGSRAFSELTESFWDSRGTEFVIQGVGR